MKKSNKVYSREDAIFETNCESSEVIVNRNHFIGIEYDFIKRKWLWNTGRVVENDFWLQYNAYQSFLQYYDEPEFRDKLTYIMIESDTDYSVPASQVSSSRPFCKLFSIVIGMRKFHH